MIVTLLLQGVKTKEWPRPCFCRGSSAKTNVTLLLQKINILKNNYDFAFAGSQKSKNNGDFAFVESRKVKNDCDFASAGSQNQRMAKTLLL